MDGVNRVGADAGKLSLFLDPSLKTTTPISCSGNSVCPLATDTAQRHPGKDVTDQ
jgi:hypothetical protein